MKILVISAALPPMRAGEATNTFHLCRHLADRGLEVHVLTSNGNAMINHPHVTVHPIIPSWSWSDVPRLVKFLKQCSPDAIFLMYVGFIYNYHPMITFIPTITKKILPKVPFITRFENIHGFQSEKTSFLTRLIRNGVVRLASKEDVDYGLGTLLRDSDRIIFLTEHHWKSLSKVFQGCTRKSVLIPPPPNMSISPEKNGASRQSGRHRLGLHDDDFLLAYFGFVYPSKGIETLLQSMQIVCSRRKNVRLVVVGGSVGKGEAQEYPFYFQEMQELAKQLQIDDKTIWTGEYKNDAEGSMYLSACDLCVLPFDKGVKLNRSSFSTAATHGLAILTSQGESLEEAFIHEENVFLCPPKDPNKMATAIETVIDDPHLKSRLQTGALRLAKEWFSWEGAIDRTIATFS